jgi:preprotein translocase subunit Sss1
MKTIIWGWVAGYTIGAVGYAIYLLLTRFVAR